MSEEASQEARAIAQGQDPAWEETYTHPVHGELTFRAAKLPTVFDWIAHENAQKALTTGTSVLGAAVAGMQTLIEVPVIDEQREEDPDNPDHETVRLIRYNPLEDEHMEFPVQVWMDFFNWRVGAISDRTKEEVKNSSGATSGDADGVSSPGPTASPQTTPE